MVEYWPKDWKKDQPFERDWTCQGCHDSKCSCEPPKPAKKPFLTLENIDGMTIAKKAHPQVVVVVPITKDNEIVLAEQFRIAVNANVIGLPAGHIGDDPGHEKENALEAAQRELLEEVGYSGNPHNFTYLGASASTPGMTDEITHFVLAKDLVKTGEGGGGEENITIHTVPIQNLDLFINNKKECIISTQMLAALWAARNFLQ